MGLGSDSGVGSDWMSRNWLLIAALGLPGLVVGLVDDMNDDGRKAALTGRDSTVRRNKLLRRGSGLCDLMGWSTGRGVRGSIAVLFCSFCVTVAFSLYLL